MATSNSPVRIGIYGTDGTSGNERHGCCLWAAGYTSCVTAAGGEPVRLGEAPPARSWDHLLDGIDGVLFTGTDEHSRRPTTGGDRLVQWCRKRRLPLLAVANGLQVMNVALGGTVYADLARELPEALQHRHPPEKGLRHAIAIEPDSRLAGVYGEGEVIVNSEHRGAVQKVARGFRVTARALDGVIEAVEAEGDDWFAVGVQWHPASATASGLDIQLFRGLVEASRLGVLELAGAA